MWKNLSGLTPLDGVVLLCGCDKTTPALVMGACSVNLPTIVVSGGPMLTGKYRGRDIGTSDIWRFFDASLNGKMSDDELFKRRSLYGPESRALRRDGYCINYGLYGRIARAFAARKCGHTPRPTRAGKYWHIYPAAE